jgi:hypothetical protein
VDVVVLFLLVVVAIAALGATRAGWIASAVAAAMTLLVVGLATWFVFSEDGYVANGSTKWETRGSSAHDLYIAAIVIATFLFFLYAILALRRIRGPVVSVAVVLGGILEAFGLLVLVLAFGSN